MSEVKEEKLKCNMKGRIKKTNQAMKTNKTKKLNGKMRNKISNKKVKCTFWRTADWTLSQLLVFTFWLFSGSVFGLSQLQVLLSYMSVFNHPLQPLASKHHVSCSRLLFTLFLGRLPRGHSWVHEQVDSAPMYLAAIFPPSTHTFWSFPELQFPHLPSGLWRWGGSLAGRLSM